LHPDNHFTFSAAPPVFVSDSGAACQVSTAQELLINDSNILFDPVRSVFTPGSSDPRNGVWTFKHLMENAAPTPGDAPAMVEAMLDTYATDQTINGFTVAARPNMPNILAQWPRTPDGKLDLAQAPVELVAIVNRFDLRDPAAGDAGEAEFVYAFQRANGFELGAHLMFKYKLPAATPDEVTGWAQAFHGLGALDRFTESYNAGLQAITDRVIARGAFPGHPNGSALSEIQSNEVGFAGSGFWEMRDFVLSPTTGFLVPAPLALTPDGSFNNTASLASFITGNQAAIIANHYSVPAMFGGQPFQAGAVDTDVAWFAPGVDATARRQFSLNTCSGCHSEAETGTNLQQLATQGGLPLVSQFMTGVALSDPGNGHEVDYDDLGRRKIDLTNVVCPDDPLPPGTR
jgi:hypothetical protein